MRNGQPILDGIQCAEQLAGWYTMRNEQPILGGIQCAEQMAGILLQ